MSKLIFFDVDGTIVTEHESLRIIPESTKTAIRQLQANGHYCFVNTGRALSEIDDTILNLGMDGFICGCGTYIFHKKDVIFEHHIPHELGNRILAAFKECKLEWILEGYQTLYYSTEEYTTHIGDFLEEHQNVFSLAFHRVPPHKWFDLDFDKFCVCTTPNSDFATFQKTFEKELTFIDRGNEFYEVVPAGCSKASGMQVLMDYFNIPKEDTIAIGDSTNDLPMLSYAGTSIAMGNSPKIVCDASTFVTDTVLEDGLYNAFDQLGLL